MFGATLQKHVFICIINSFITFINDECRLELFERKREFVRGQKGTRFHEKYTTKSMKFVGGSVIALGATKEDLQKENPRKMPRSVELQWLHGCLKQRAVANI